MTKADVGTPLSKMRNVACVCIAFLLLFLFFDSIVLPERVYETKGHRYTLKGDLRRGNLMYVLPKLEAETGKLNNLIKYDYLKPLRSQVRDDADIYEDISTYTYPRIIKKTSDLKFLERYLGSLQNLKSTDHYVVSSDYILLRIFSLSVRWLLTLFTVAAVLMYFVMLLLEEVDMSRQNDRDEEYERIKAQVLADIEEEKKKHTTERVNIVETGTDVKSDIETETKTETLTEDNSGNKKSTVYITDEEYAEHYGRTGTYEGREDEPDPEVFPENTEITGGLGENGE